MALPHDPIETVIISKADYEGMVEDSRFLESLQSAGVDNWQGYSYACEIFLATYPEYKEE